MFCASEENKMGRNKFCFRTNALLEKTFGKMENFYSLPKNRFHPQIEFRYTLSISNFKFLESS